MASPVQSPRTRLFADPAGKFLHEVILESCRRNHAKVAVVDASCTPPCRITYAAYGEMVEMAAAGMIAADINPGDSVAIFLPNCWEFGVAFHAAMLAGAVPTTLNPTYREREVRYQLENSDAVALITDGSVLGGISLSGLPSLRRVYTIRTPGPSGSEPFDTLFEATGGLVMPTPERPPQSTLATLPYSSGTTGMPKGVMLTHYNLVANVYQTLTPGEYGAFAGDDVMLCFLPLYHIYGLTVGLNLALVAGMTLVLMPRFDCEQSVKLMMEDAVTVTLCVPPTLLTYCQMAEQGKFPRDHHLRWVKSGAAPLAPELARRFTATTGIPIRQGYGMTEASPVTHLGFLAPELYRPDSIGAPVVQTECLVVDEKGNEVSPGAIGELVMRGPQFMQGYWKAPEATTAVLRDGWYWSGDIVRIDECGMYYVVDRRKEMIKYKGFSIAPAEVESVMLEHPSVRDCGVVSRIDAAGEEIPCAFVVLRESEPTNQHSAEKLQAFIAERLTHYKMPREIYFVPNLPRTASGKILRRELRKRL
jgi:acyl-CoA synthetase (AMP-forming)/AMP-acid ligase II